MTAATVSLGTARPSPSNASLSGLDAVNFFLAGILAGFGPYVAAYLAEQKWTQENIGFVLTASGLAGLLSQLPGGELLDTVRSKRAVVVAGVAMVAASAIIIAFQPSFPLVFTALMLQGSTGGFLGPAIVAISLGLVGHAALPERLGRNQRFSSTGNLVTAALMGLIGYFLSYQAIFLTVAALALPLFVALARIRAADIHLRRLPVPVSTRQRFRAAACGRGSRIPGRKALLARRFRIDRSAADRRCRDGSLGRAMGKKLGPPAASPHRARRFADPRAAVRFSRRSDAGCCFSIARWHQRSGVGRVDGAGHRRCHRRHRSLQLGPRRG